MNLQFLQVRVWVKITIAKREVTKLSAMSRQP